ncbi:MAG: hypothetical protein GTN36_01070 [Candidatus Aenigmarchaeota archaeon]|nr:hypothetical protein [Candidatus Aenigmarchaeota archaeon]
MNKEVIICVKLVQNIERRKRKNNTGGLNMKTKEILIIFFIFLFFISETAFAHQPRIVSEQITLIRNPEVSQAFYGILKGKPDYYHIDSEKQFNLYVGILVPDIENIDKDVSVKVVLEHEHEEEHEETEYILNGTDHEWTYYYEEFGGDSYYQGPELKTTAEKGTYIIEVFSQDNDGKYVLVVGEKEEFPLDEFINTIITLPRLKEEFFEKPAYTAFFNLIGLFLLVIVVVVIAIIYVIFRFIKKRKK